MKTCNKTLRIILALIFFKFISIKILAYSDFSKGFYGFIENKGQIHDQNFKPNTAVKYLLSIKGMNIQLKQNGFSYDTYTVEKINTEDQRGIALTKLKRPAFENTYHFHRVDVEFIGANRQPEIVTENQAETYYNYYTPGASQQGATNVHMYEKVTYKNIYPNIDLEFIAKEGNMKYNFILRYGSDMNNIKWKYHGANSTEIKNNDISIYVKQGEFKESIPESYLNSNSLKVKQLKVEFTKDANAVYGFVCNQKSDLTPNQVFVIDPNPVVFWSTYFAGPSTDYLYSSCLDGFKNVFATGYSSSTSAIATTGAFQTTYGGGTYDAVIFKLSSNGANLKWATYYGSNGDDEGYSIIIDKLSNIYVGGWTAGSASILATIGSHQPTYGGGPYDAFLAKFDTNGVRIWSTYYGGSGDDGNGALTIDSLNNVYLIGATSSTNAISTLGSYQTAYGGGPYDAFFAKFDSNGNRQWSTYYGGSGDDNGLAGTVGISNFVYITGITSSTLGISTLAAHQTGFGGGNDAFIISFDSNGNRQWGTYYGGSGNNDMGLGIYYDKISGLYVTGETDSNDSIATAGSHQSTFGGGNTDAFLAKFNANGVRQWATYYGGTDFDYGLTVMTDSFGVVFGGASRSFSSIASSNALQTNLNPGFYGDAILIKFDKNGNRQWGTYYGGALGEQIYSVNIPSSGEIYVVGGTSSFSMSTAGSYQTNGGGNWEGFCTMFRQNTITSLNTFGKKNETDNLVISPNPNNGVFTIKANSDMTLKFLDELGRLVKIVLLDKWNNYQVTISDFETGVYFIYDYIENKTMKNKIIVLR